MNDKVFSSSELNDKKHQLTSLKLNFKHTFTELHERITEQEELNENEDYDEIKDLDQTISTIFSEAKSTMDEAIEIVNILSDDTDTFPTGLSTLPADLQWESNLNYILEQFEKIDNEINDAIDISSEKEQIEHLKETEDLYAQTQSPNDKIDEQYADAQDKSQERA